MKNKVKIVKIPGPIRLLSGGALAYWLSHIINPAFVSIAVMIVLFIPIFLSDYFIKSVDMENAANQPDPIKQKHATKVRPAEYGSTSNFLIHDDDINVEGEAEGEVEGEAEGDKKDESGLRRAKLTN